MAEILEFDDMNTQRSVPYEEYFGEMDLSEDQKENRIEFSKQLEDVVLLILTLIATYGWTADEAARELKQKYLDVVGRFDRIDAEFDQYATTVTAAIIDSTFRHEDDGYYFSPDRAMSIAENEANATFNHLEYLEAIESGKTKKRWVDIRDKRERKTHAKVGGTVIPIEETFTVGDWKMRYPHDIEAGPEETVNCRCSIKYF